MRRREFVGRVLGTLAAVPAFGACAASARTGAPSAEPVPRVRAAPSNAVLQLAPWGEELARDLDATLAAARALGVAAVEWPSPYAPFGRPRQEVRAALDRAGLWAASTMVGTGLLYRGWDRALEAARALGCTRVTASGPGPEERRTAADWPEMIDAYAAAAERARAGGLGFAVRTDAWMHAGADGHTPLAALLADAEATEVGVALDVRAAQSVGDAVGAARLVGPRLASLHLRPYDLEDRALVGALHAATSGAATRWIVMPEGGPRVGGERLRHALRAVRT